MNVMAPRAALYLRRSTDEHQEESLKTQETNATRYVAVKGFRLDPRHIYTDDAISRAEFKKRPGLIAMLNAVERREVDVVVVRDETRLGGDMHRTGIVMQDIHDAGVRLYYYSDEEVALETAVDKFLVAARNFASELEREKVSARTYENLRLKAGAGYNAGGRVFGFDNVVIFATGPNGETVLDRDGKPKRVRTEYAIHPEQAALVVEMAGMYAAGAGYRTIAKLLNARGIRSPRVGKRGTGTWSQAAIKTIIENPKYRGEFVWNRFEKGYRKGTKVRTERPETEWIRVSRPDLRIFDEDLCARLDARRAQKAKFKGARGRVGREPKYLLSGLARCGCCGGPMKVSGGKDGTKPIKVYGCGWHRDRGDSVCANTLRRPVAGVDEALIAWVHENVLREDLILDVLAEVRRRVAERSRSNDEMPRLAKEVRRLEAEIETFTNALLATDAKPASIVRTIAEREEQLGHVKAQIAVAKTAPAVLDLEVRRMQEEARRRLGDFRRMLRTSPVEGRRALQAILEGPLRFTATAKRRYEIRGGLTMGGALFAVDGEPGRGMFTTGSVPRGIRTLVATVKGWSPGPLDDGDSMDRKRRAEALSREGIEPSTDGLKARCSTG
jgi:site-specific DNA recombinase